MTYEKFTDRARKVIQLANEQPDKVEIHKTGGVPERISAIF